MRIPNKFNGYSADNRRLYNDPATIGAATLAEIAAPAAIETAALTLPEIAGLGGLADFVGATGSYGVGDALASSIAAQSTATGLTGLPGLLEGATLAQALPFGMAEPATYLADSFGGASFTDALPELEKPLDLFNPATEASYLDPLQEAQAGAKATATGSMTGEGTWADIKKLAEKPNWANIKAFANDNPKTALALGLMGLQMLKPKTPRVGNAPQYVRPYTSNRTMNPNVGAYAPYSGGSTAERNWFTGGLQAQPIQRVAAEGGLMSFAVGGPIETMSAMNAVGQNLGYPQSQLQPDIYSNPSTQRPQAMNMIASSADVNVDPYTGEEKFASGGLGGYSDGGRLLKGPGDGVSDSIPATIGGRRPARLADGEFVVPARIVSELGNGSTEAGARKLYAMMDRVQNARKKSVGKEKVAVNSKADKYLPA